MNKHGFKKKITDSVPCGFNFKQFTISNMKCIFQRHKNVLLRNENETRAQLQNIPFIANITGNDYHLNNPCRNI